MIKSISYNQDEILKWILSLCKLTTFDCDPTYSKGNFYKAIPEPKLKFDISPGCSGVIKSDCRQLPLSDESLHSLMFDPPFLATKGKSLQAKSGNIINKRFSVFPDEKSLHQFYIDSLKEFYRVIKPNGFLIFKCQDKVSSGKQYFSHVFVHNKAIEIGFYPKDLFILLAKNRIVANWQRNQQHARKFHSYFWVLQKKSRHIQYT